MQVSACHVYLNLLKLRRANVGFVLDITGNLLWDVSPMFCC